jgi:uncharacterized protein YgiM (DUF1202 family)
MRTAKSLLFSVTILLFSVTLVSLTGCNALEIHPNPAFMPSTVTPIPSEVTPISVTYTPEVTLKSEQITPIPVFSVTADTLEIRSGPGENYPNIGYLRAGDTVAVMETTETPREACQNWARIGVDRWVCAEYLRER